MAAILKMLVARLGASGRDSQKLIMIKSLCCDLYFKDRLTLNFARTVFFFLPGGSAVSSANN